MVPGEEDTSSISRSTKLLRGFPYLDYFCHLVDVFTLLFLRTNLGLAAVVASGGLAFDETGTLGQEFSVLEVLLLGEMPLLLSWLGCLRASVWLLASRPAIPSVPVPPSLCTRRTGWTATGTRIAPHADSMARLKSSGCAETAAAREKEFLVPVALVWTKVHS